MATTLSQYVPIFNEKRQAGQAQGNRDCQDETCPQVVVSHVPSAHSVYVDRWGLMSRATITPHANAYSDAAAIAAVAADSRKPRVSCCSEMS